MDIQNKIEDGVEKRKRLFIDPEGCTYNEATNEDRKIEIVEEMIEV